jgi:hypothetical protein
MKGEHPNSGEASLDLRTTTDTPASRTRSGKRTSAQSDSVNRTVRFFLSKGDGNGTPDLDRELASEAEAIVESLKTGKNYFAISEWKGSADLSKKVPLIRKEAVTSKKDN